MLFDVGLMVFIGPSSSTKFQQEKNYSDKRRLCSPKFKFMTVKFFILKSVGMAGRIEADDDRSLR